MDMYFAFTLCKDILIDILIANLIAMYSTKVLYYISSLLPECQKKRKNSINLLRTLKHKANPIHDIRILLTLYLILTPTIQV